MASLAEPALEQSASGTGAAKTSWSTSGILVRLALLLTGLAYARTVTYDFVFDDHLQIVLNPLIQAWRFVPRYFTGQVWSFQQPNWAGNYYRPFFLLWLRAANAVAGVAPGWWHLLSIGAHVVATWLVYCLGLKLLRNPHQLSAGNENVAMGAASAALIFGALPTHVEAVAWISGIAEPLLAIFCMLSFLGYLNWREGGKRRNWWLVFSLACFAAALLEKESGIVLPGIILVHFLACDEDREKAKRAATLMAPFAVVIAAYLLARWNVLHGVVSPQQHRPLAAVIWTWPRMMWFYLRHLAWPFGLSYYYDVLLVKTPTVGQFVLPALGLVVLAAGSVRLCGKHKRILTAGFAMVAPILPVIAGSIVFQPDDYVHDRYLYLSTVPLCLLLGAGVMRLPMRRAAQAAVAGALGVGLAAATAIQCAPWDNDIALFEHARRHAPHNIRAIQDLASSYGTLGQSERARQLMLEAIRQRPDSWESYYGVGVSYYEDGRYSEAERFLVQAIHVWPRHVQPMRATQFYYLGMAQMAQGRTEEAEPMLRRAVELRPDAPGYHRALGTALRKLGKPEQAEIEFQAEAVNRKRLDEQQKELGGSVR